VATRCVAGICLSLEAPSSLQLALCLENAVSPKQDWLNSQGFSVEWPVFGLPTAFHVDNGRDSRSRERAVVLDTIKAFSTTSQINVICAGTPAVEREFRSDPQIERRFSVKRFTAWTAGPALQRFVATYERARPLRLLSGLSQPDMIRAPLSETGGITHRIMQCLNSAAAAKNSEIRQVSRQLNSGNTGRENPTVYCRGGGPA
jgi:hypothetical protein